MISDAYTVVIGLVYLLAVNGLRCADGAYLSGADGAYLYGVAR